MDNFIGVMEGFIGYNNLEEQAMVLESMSEFLLPQKAIKLYGHLVEIMEMSPTVPGAASLMNIGRLSVILVQNNAGQWGDVTGKK